MAFAIAALTLLTITESYVTARGSSPAPPQGDRAVSFDGHERRSGSLTGSGARADVPDGHQRSGR